MKLIKLISRKINEKTALPYFLTVPTAVILFALFIYPLVYLLVLVFGSHSFPYVHLDAFTYLNRPVFWYTVRITVIYFAGTLAGTVIIGFLCAYLLNRINKGSLVFNIIFILPLAMAPIAAARNWCMILNTLYGILNYIIGFLGIPPQEWLTSIHLAVFSVITVTVWRWTPLAILILYAGLKKLPRAPVEAAALDGASEWQILRYVTLPLLKPVLVVAMLLESIICFKEFDVIYGLTKGGPAEMTKTLVVRAFIDGYEFMNLENAAVIGVMLLIAGLVIAKLGHKILTQQS